MIRRAVCTAVAIIIKVWKSIEAERIYVCNGACYEYLMWRRSDWVGRLEESSACERVQVNHSDALDHWSR